MAPSFVLEEARNKAFHSHLSHRASFFRGQREQGLAEHLFVSRATACLGGPLLLSLGVFVPDFLLSERQHVFLHRAVRGIKGPEWGHIKRDGHEKLVKCITKPTH